MRSFKETSKGVKAILCALVVLMVIGFGCWIAQQVYGLGITGMSNGTSWGLYISPGRTSCRRWCGT